MEEDRRKRMDAELRRMIVRQNQAKNENGPAKITPRGTKAIRRRKGTPDKHIT